MKKYYQSPEFAKHSERSLNIYLKNKRKEDIEKRRKKHKKARRAEKKQQLVDSTIPYQNIHIKKNVATIDAPEHFSLINNPDETLQFYDMVQKQIDQHRDIFLNLSKVNKITTDSILYLLSRIEYNRNHSNKVNFEGNQPEDDNCKKIMQTSGFFKYVYNNIPSQLHNDPLIYSVVSGTMVAPEKARDVKEFMKARLQRDESREAKIVYEILIECMANTKNHAYQHGSPYSKWWLMAYVNDDRNSVHFTFLDNGLGIPSTVKKNHSEKLRQLFGDIPFVRLNDGMLIKSALDGDFRTSTELTYRGKGLPKIKEYSTNNKINNLSIISKRGYANADNDEFRSMGNPFHGTLLSWDFV